MPGDYKNRARGKKKRKPVSPWFGLAAGLAMGLFVAFLVYIKMQPTDRQVFVQDSVTTSPGTVHQDVRDVSKDNKQVIPPPPKPTFTFYTDLPEMEVVIPEQEIRGKSEAGIKQVQQPGTYYLQVGSFRSKEQAHRFRAELTLQGLKVSIQEVTINNTDTFHRVRVGPYKELDALNQARRSLNKQGIESKLVKITG